MKLLGTFVAAVALVAAQDDVYNDGIANQLHAKCNDDYAECKEAAGNDKNAQDACKKTKQDCHEAAKKMKADEKDKKKEEAAEDGGAKDACKDAKGDKKNCKQDFKAAELKKKQEKKEEKKGEKQGGKSKDAATKAMKECKKKSVEKCHALACDAIYKEKTGVCSEEFMTLEYFGYDGEYDAGSFEAIVVEYCSARHECCSKDGEDREAACASKNGQKTKKKAKKAEKKADKKALKAADKEKNKKKKQTSKNKYKNKN